MIQIRAPRSARVRRRALAGLLILLAIEGAGCGGGGSDRGAAPLAASVNLDQERYRVTLTISQITGGNDCALQVGNVILRDEITFVQQGNAIQIIDSEGTLILSGTISGDTINVSGTFLATIFAGTGLEEDVSMNISSTRVSADRIRLSGTAEASGVGEDGVSTCTGVLDIQGVNLAPPPPEGQGDENPPGDENPTAPDVNFAGGDLDALRETSSGLRFGTLQLDGILRLDLRQSITVFCDDLVIAPAGGVRFEKSSACEHGPSPSFSVRSNGDVTIDGNIDLRGESGQRSLVDASCNSCEGRDGGNVSIIANSIRVSGTIDTSGGDGSTAVFSTPGIPDIGCAGGDGGDLCLQAEAVDVSGASLDTSGGRGGPGQGGRSGRAGAAGALKGLSEESEPNDSLRAAPIIDLPDSIIGTIHGEDAGSRNAAIDTFLVENGVPGRPVQDWFRFEVSGLLAPVEIYLDYSGSPSGDIDLYVVNADGSTIVARSLRDNVAEQDFSENVSLVFSPGTYYIAVQAFDVPTRASYRLTIGSGGR